MAELDARLICSNNQKCNLTATSDPLVTDDDSLGYAVGSRWVNVTLDKAFSCLDATTGAAVWVKTTYGDADAMLIKLDDFAAPDDNTDLDASLTTHGLCPKGTNSSIKYLTGQMAWKQPYHNQLFDVVGGTVHQHVDVILAGVTPVRSDVSGWADGDRGIGLGTDGSVWDVYRKTSVLVYATEMSEVGS